MKYLCILTYLISLSINSSIVASEFSCSDVLQWGLFNEEYVSSNQATNKSFHSWQCTNDIKTRDEALNTGFGIKTILESLPFDAFGNVDITKRDAWRNTNCSIEDRNSSSSSNLDKMKKTASKQILNAWNTCIRDIHNQATNTRNSLICNVERGNDSKIYLELGRKTTSTNIIDVSGFQLSGVENSTNFKLVKFPILPTKYIFNRQPINKGKIPEFNLVVNTNAGSCSATFPEFEDIHQGNFVLSNTIEISQDTNSQFEKITILDNTIIKVRHGVKFHLEAHEIEIGDNVVIDGTGDVGKNGENAVDNPNVDRVQGAATSRDACYYAIENNRTTKGPSGQNGSDGGSGAAIEIVSNNITGKGAKTIKIIVDGGLGGAGGNGALYKMLQCIGPNGRVAWSSRMGIQGLVGTKGRQGNSGPLPIVGGVIKNHYIAPKESQ